MRCERKSKARASLGARRVTFERLSGSCVRACRVAQFCQAAWHRPSQARDQSALRLRIREYAHTEKSR